MTHARHVWTAFLVVALGCDPEGGLDAGLPADGAAGTGRVTIAFEALEEGSPGEWELAEAWVRIDEVRADNDRGPGFEPTWAALGRVRIDENPPVMDLVGAPATYGGVTLLADGRGDPTLELRWGVAEETVELVSTTPFTITTRCEAGGVSLFPDGAVRLGPELNVAAIAARLDAATLPAAVDGVFRIDATTAPALLAEVEGALGGAWITRCEGGEDL